jgi:hypothetical protein
MKKLILTAVFLAFAKVIIAQDNKVICVKINSLNNLVLNGSIKKSDAARQLRDLILELGTNLPIEDNISRVFPLQGYNYKAIGGTNGSGYSAKGYDYFDGNKHAGHPAHDIFIRDKNQDCLDDLTHQPVNVLSIADGIVIACTDNWDSKSSLRGGRFIWIFHRSLREFTYYAHNRKIFVKPGDVVKQGQKIAEVGRTGYNAYKKRSPTHLHFSAFFVDDDGFPKPYNSYFELTKAITR